MKLVVISPEASHPREAAVMGDLFAAGLERYHLRKPHASAKELEAWLRTIPTGWRSRMIVHQHYELVSTLGLGGRHWRDDGSAPSSPPPPGDRGLTSRSCHDLVTLDSALGSYDSVFFGPVFPSLSKPDHGPRAEIAMAEISALLESRAARERRTTVLALGGITVDTVPQACEIGFDGVAVLGAVWLAADPVAAFVELKKKCSELRRSSDHSDAWDRALAPRSIGKTAVA